MERTKIQLSADELLLMRNSDWILTKNSVIEKISQALGELSSRMQQHFTANLPLLEDGIVPGTPKVSKGEKYLGLPYVILDYPRLFDKEHILAIRTLFWWGNYCSITLHVKGAWQQVVQRNLESQFKKLRPGSFYISFSGDEWSHDVHDTNYSLLEMMRGDEILQTLPSKAFLKLTAKVEIGPWNIVEKELYDLFLNLVELLKP